MPGLEQIVVIAGYDAPQPPKIVMTWETLRRLGRDNEASGKATLTERVETTQPGDLATIVYTSGTTGPPKGVMQTHANHVAAVKASMQATPVEEGWVHLLFLPLAHSFARPTASRPRSPRTSTRSARTSRRRARTSSAACRASSRRCTRRSWRAWRRAHR